MKKISTIFLALLILCLLAGASYDTAPVLPTKDFYINDYAGTLFREHMSELSEIAHQTYADTNIQFILLATSHLGDMSPEEYATATLSGWDIQAPNGYGMIMLVDRSIPDCYLFTGKELSSIVSAQEFEQIKQDAIMPFFKENNFSTGMLTGYKEVSRRIYLKNGLDLPSSLEVAAVQGKTGIPTGMLIFIAVAFLALARSMYVTHKYKKKYMYRHEYKRRDFSSKQFRDDDINPNDLRTNPHQEHNGDPTVRKSGFVIYRDKEEDETSSSD